MLILIFFVCVVGVTALQQQSNVVSGREKIGPVNEGVKQLSIRTHQRAQSELSVPGVLTSLGASGATKLRYDGKTPVFESATGSIEACFPDPNNPSIAYAMTSTGGIWKSENADTDHPQWRVITDTIKTSCFGGFAFDLTSPSTYNSSVIVIATGRTSSFASISNHQPQGFAGMMRSTDGGETWERIPAATFYNYQVVLSRGTTILGSAYPDFSNANHVQQESGGVTLLKNLGQPNQTIGPWSLDCRGVDSMVGPEGQPNVVYVAASKCSSSSLQGIYRSDNLGDNWVKISPSAFQVTDGSARLAVSKDGARLVVVGNDGTDGSVLNFAYYHDSPIDGSNWVEMTIPRDAQGYLVKGSASNEEVYFNHIEMHPSDNNVVYVGSYGDIGAMFNVERGIVLEGHIDSGTWTDLTTNRSFGVHFDTRQIHFDNSERMIIGTDGGIFRRNADGQFFNIGTNIVNFELTRISVDGSTRTEVADSSLTRAAQQDNGGATQDGTSREWTINTEGDGGTTATWYNETASFGIVTANGGAEIHTIDCVSESGACQQTGLDNGRIGGITTFHSSFHATDYNKLAFTSSQQSIGFLQNLTNLSTQYINQTVGQSLFDLPNLMGVKGNCGLAKNDFRLRFLRQKTHPNIFEQNRWL